MVHEVINGTFRQTNLPNESDEYLTKREELRLAEIALMRQSEQVADLRRSLPQGAVIQDYEFGEGPADLDAGDTPIQKVRLSELFTTPGRSVVGATTQEPQVIPTSPASVCAQGYRVGRGNDDDVGVLSQMIATPFQPSITFPRR